MKRDNLNIHVYNKVKHFMQWGTPEDLEEFLHWMKIFESPERAKAERKKYIDAKTADKMKTFDYWHEFFEEVEFYKRSKRNK